MKRKVSTRVWKVRLSATKASKTKVVKLFTEQSEHSTPERSEKTMLMTMPETKRYGPLSTFHYVMGVKGVWILCLCKVTMTSLVLCIVYV